MWRAKAPHERGRILRRAAELMRERTDYIARLATQEEGKTLTEARWEVGLSAEIFEWYAEEGRRATLQVRLWYPVDQAEPTRARVPDERAACGRLAARQGAGRVGP